MENNVASRNSAKDPQRREPTHFQMRRSAVRGDEQRDRSRLFNCIWKERDDREKTQRQREEEQIKIVSETGENGMAKVFSPL